MHSWWLPLLEGYRQSGDESYLKAAIKGTKIYLEELKTHGFTTAGALDIFSIDKESGIPLLKASTELYRLTRGEGVAGGGQGQRLVSFHLAVYPYLSFRPVLHTGADRL